MGRLTLLHLSAAWTVGKRASVTALWLLIIIGAGVLISLCRKVADPQVTGNRDWNNVPKWIRAVLTPIQKAMGPALLLVPLLVCIQLFEPSLKEHLAYRIVVRGVADVLIAMYYALAALFLSYGELRPFAERKEPAPIP